MLRPLRDHILVKPLERQDSQILNIVTNRRMYRGEVKAIGKGRYERKQVKVGDKVELRDNCMTARPLYVKLGDIVNWGESPLQFPEYHEDGVKYLILQEADVAFVEESTI